MIAVTAALSALPRETQREIAVDPDADVIVVTTALGTLLACGLPGVRECVADALRAWCAEQTDARDVLRTLTRYERRLGAWLACQVSRTTLRYVPAGEDRPRLGIETAERWVRGEATAQECRRAADAAKAANAAAYDADAAWAASAAADAANAANAAAYDADAYAAYAAYAAAYAYAGAAWTVARDRRLHELCGVCADAIHGALDAIAERRFTAPSGRQRQSSAGRSRGTQSRPSPGGRGRQPAVDGVARGDRHAIDGLKPWEFKKSAR